MTAIGFQTIPTNEIRINEYELAQRLNTQKGFRSELIEQNLKRLSQVINCKFSFSRVSVKRLGENRLDCGFGEFESEVLLKNLKDCQEAFVFAVTLGIDVDRLLNKLAVISTTDYFVTDALASALAEAAAGEAERRIKGEVLCRPRFSPGFGDLSLEVQPRIIRSIDAQKLLGVTLGKTYLMSPMKTVTAIMGIV